MTDIESHIPDRVSIPEDRIHAILVEHVYKYAQIAMTGTLVNASILVFVLRNHIAHRILTAWLTITVLTAVIRLIMIYRFHRTKSERKNYKRWGQLQNAGLFISGVIWGSTAIFLFPVNSDALQVFITFVLAGMVAGAAGTFSASLSAFMAFSLPALIPVVIRFLFLGDEMHLSMGAMTCIFAVLVFTTAVRNNRSIRELVTLRENFAAELENRTSELKNSEQRFHTIADNISQFAWMADAAGKISWFNKRWYENTGTTFADVAERGWEKLLHPDYKQRSIKKLNRSFETGQPWEDVVPLRMKEGDYRWFLSRALPIFDDSGKIARWFGTNTDITERLQAERSLQVAHDQLEAKVGERTVELEKSNTDFKELARKTIEAMESDRRTLSRELHDSIGGTLAAVIYQLEYLREQENIQTAALEASLDKVIPHLRTAIMETRRITKQLRPSILDDFGLEAAIMEHVSDFKLYHLDIQIYTEINISEENLASDISTVLYRVFQESLNNIAKHSGADTVWVKLNRVNDKILLKVQDNGVGFSHGEYFGTDRTMATYGLHSMRERVEICRGEFNVESDLGKGTTITASIPLDSATWFKEN